ncbi:MAG: POTRA domain-containing protein [Acidobacteriota bacterium]
MWFFLLAFAVLAGPFQGHAQTPVTDFPIDAITVEGNRILTPAGIAAASGLKTGEKGDTAIFDAARDRLLATGYFETVAYRFRAAESGSGYHVTFEVQEMQPLYPLRIEALPATVPEVVAWLHAKDPLFTGKIPGTRQVLDRTAREIEQYLESKGHPAKVGGKVILVAEQKYEAQFMPAAGLPNVALVSFEGNKAIRDTDLQNSIAAVAFGQPYTESNFRLLLDNQLKPRYEKDGYMRVKFGKLTTTPSVQVRGIDVHVPIEEGPQYKLGAITVRGSMEDQSKHILRVAKVPKMAVADFDQLRQAAIRVKDDLRHEGYLDADVSVDRDINDETKTVDAFFVPQPGTQYTFGKLDVKGLGLDGVAAVTKAWVVKTGDPYPAEYPDYFLKQVAEQGWFDNLGETRSEPEINAETHVVNVTLYFRYNPDAKKKKIPQPGEAPPGQQP